nr:TerB N-terminal domain-containing protein [Pseudonocardia sp.]
MPQRPPVRPAVATGIPVGGRARWIPSGQDMEVGGYAIPGGMLYVGSGLRAATGDVEPALIDPALRINKRNPDLCGQGMDYWPSYSTIPPACRAAYLAWLAGGRSDPRAYIGYVFLYFYGLERLVLIDAPRHAPLRHGVPAATAEVCRLLQVYGENRSFGSYASSFLELLAMLDLDPPATAAGPPPERAPQHWEAPVALRAGLGWFAQHGRPVPADWALAWAWYHPSIYARTPQTRCREEFDALFRIRYPQPGLRPRAGRTRLGLYYRPASAGIPSRHVELPDVPDVLEQAAPTRKLAQLVDAVTGELDPYSRWLGRHPEGRGTLAAAALLPNELIGHAGAELNVLRTWLDQRLGGRDRVPVNAAELIEHWPTARPDKMTRAEAVSFAQLLGRLGVGVEPDVRLLGPPLAPGPAVLFRIDADAPHVASPAYAAATTLMHLAVAVGAADGSVTPDEHDHLLRHLESALHLTGAERRRLEAHLDWLLVSEVKLTGLKKRLGVLDVAQGAAIGDFLLTVAVADGVISPGEVRTLTKIYKLLGLDPQSVPARLHQRLTAARPAPATDPVTVRPARAGSAGYAIPAATHRQAQAGLVLDEAAIAAKLAETAQVSALLADIFTEDEPLAPIDERPGTDPVAGLDSAHSGLLRAMAARPAWSQADYVALAQQFGVLPAGALDVMNDAALEACGEPVAEGDDEIELNPEALQELLR